MKWISLKQGNKWIKTTLNLRIKKKKNNKIDEETLRHFQKILRRK